MSERNDGGPAYPVWELNGQNRPEMTGFGMSLRQYAAIKLRVPDSGTGWLDDMIRQSLRDEAAAKAMPVCMTAEVSRQECAGMAYAMADAMLAAREGP